MRDVDRDNEVTRILTAFKLNPYEQLNLRFTATLEDVKKQFRKVRFLNLNIYSISGYEFNVLPSRITYNCSMFCIHSRTHPAHK